MVASSIGVKSYVEEEGKSMKTDRLARYGVLSWRKILVLYRQVRRRRAVGLCRGVFRRRTCDTGIWTKPLALAADAGFAMGFQSIFASEGLPEAGFAKRAVIDADRCFHERFA